MTDAAQRLEVCYSANSFYGVCVIVSVSRVMIIGGPGSGKSWLGQQLSNLLGLPIYSIDEAVWDSNGNLRPEKTIDKLVLEQISNDRWIIEGGNSRTYAERARKADLIIRLNPPIWLRLVRILRRDGPKYSMLTWTIKYDKFFGAKDRTVLKSKEDPQNCIELRSNKDCKDFLSKLSTK